MCEFRLWPLRTYCTTWPSVFSFFLPFALVSKTLSKVWIHCIGNNCANSFYVGQLTRKTHLDPHLRLGVLIDFIFCVKQASKRVSFSAKLQYCFCVFCEIRMFVGETRMAENHNGQALNRKIIHKHSLFVFRFDI